MSASGLQFKATRLTNPRRKIREMGAQTRFFEGFTSTKQPFSQSVSHVSAISAVFFLRDQLEDLRLHRHLEAQHGTTLGDANFKTSPSRFFSGNQELGSLNFGTFCWANSKIFTELSSYSHQPVRWTRWTPTSETTSEAERCKSDEAHAKNH